MNLDPDETTQDTSRPLRETVVGILGKRPFSYACEDVHAQAHLVRDVHIAGDARAELTRVYDATADADQARTFVDSARKGAAEADMDLHALEKAGDGMEVEPAPDAHAAATRVHGEQPPVPHGEDPSVTSPTAPCGQGPMEADARQPGAPQDAHPSPLRARVHAHAPSHDDHLAQAVTTFLAGRAFAYANGNTDEQARALLAAVRGERNTTPGDARAQRQRRNFVHNAKAAARAARVDLCALANGTRALDDNSGVRATTGRPPGAVARAEVASETAPVQAPPGQHPRLAGAPGADTPLQGQDQALLDLTVTHGHQRMEVDACEPVASPDAHAGPSPGGEHASAPSHDGNLGQVVARFLADRAFAYANGDKDEQARALLAAVRGQCEPTPGDPRAQQQRWNFVHRAKAAALRADMDLCAMASEERAVGTSSGARATTVRPPGAEAPSQTPPDPLPQFAAEAGDMELAYFTRVLDALSTLDGRDEVQATLRSLQRRGSTWTLEDDIQLLLAHYRATLTGGDVTRLTGPWGKTPKAAYVRHRRLVEVLGPLHAEAFPADPSEELRAHVVANTGPNAWRRLDEARRREEVELDVSMARNAEREKPACDGGAGPATQDLELPGLGDSEGTEMLLESTFMPVIPGTRPPDGAQWSSTRGPRGPHLRPSPASRTRVPTGPTAGPRHLRTTHCAHAGMPLPRARRVMG